MKPADWAWTAVAAGVLAYEAAAARREWELLSEAADRYRAAHPIATTITVAYLAAHLIRAVPRRVDPLYLLGTWCRR